MAVDSTTGAAESTDPAVSGVRLAFDLRNATSSAHWAFSTRMIEILEWVCGTDRQFEHARRKALDLIHKEDDTLKAIINRMVKEPALQARVDKENGNG